MFQIHINRQRLNKEHALESNLTLFLQSLQIKHNNVN